MSAREMMSRDQRTMAMSALGTAGEASGAEMTVSVRGYDIVKSVLWFRLYASLVVTIKAPNFTPSPPS
jgi:hypothetical protein